MRIVEEHAVGSILLQLFQPAFDKSVKQPRFRDSVSRRELVERLGGAVGQIDGQALRPRPGRGRSGHSGKMRTSEANCNGLHPSAA